MDAAIEAQAVSLTKELIAIPSENPTGDEFAMADRMEAFFRGIGLEAKRERVSERRENVTAEITGEQNGPALVFLNHMDTVPAGEGWSRDPFLATEEGGKIWGRGSCDMKGGIAASLAAVENLKMRIDGGAKAKGTVRCCMVVDEESGCMTGTEAAIASGHIHADDIVISCEPTELALVTAQKGAMWFELVFSGKSAHAATPHMGADAIHAASHAVVALQEAVAQLPYEDPSAGTMHHDHQHHRGRPQNQRGLREMRDADRLPFRSTPADGGHPANHSRESRPGLRKSERGRILPARHDCGPPARDGGHRQRGSETHFRDFEGNPERRA